MRNDSTLIPAWDQLMTDVERDCRMRCIGCNSYLLAVYTQGIETKKFAFDRNPSSFLLLLWSSILHIKAGIHRPSTFVSACLSVDLRTTADSERSHFSIYNITFAYNTDQRLFIYLFIIHSFIHSFIQSFVRSSVRSFIYLFIYLCIYLFIHSFIEQM